MSVLLHFRFLNHLRQNAAVTIREGGWSPSFSFSLNGITGTTYYCRRCTDQRIEEIKQNKVFAIV